MLRPSHIHGMALIALSVGLSDCRKVSHEKDGIITRPRENQTSQAEGMSLSDHSYLRITGDTHTMRIDCIQRDEKGGNSPVTVTLRRLNPALTARALDFPSSFAVQEQSFKEDNVTFFMTTGYVARKRLLFHRMRCDHPGSLHVMATMTPQGNVMDDAMDQREPRPSRLWLLPFEAEVVSTPHSLVIENEGEILLLWHFRQPGDDESPSWQSLLGDYDAGSSAQPDLTVVADALQAEAARSKD